MRATGILKKVLGIDHTRVVAIAFEPEALFLTVKPTTRRPRCASCMQPCRRVHGRRRRRWRHVDAESLAIDVAGSMHSARVVDVLARLVSLHGAPRYLRCDNGPEFIATAIVKWAIKEGIETAFIDPGKPWQNGTDERFNGRFRDECLSMEWCRFRAEAAVVIEAWRRHYNEVRPHSSLGYLTPNECKRKCTDSNSSRGGAISQIRVGE